MVPRSVRKEKIKVERSKSSKREDGLNMAGS